MPRWDDEELVGVKRNPKDCIDCKYMIESPENGICTVFKVTKPDDVYFEGKSCPRKIKNE